MRSILVAAILASSALAQVRYFSASLDGAQEVPANASAGQGFGIVRFDASTNAVQMFCYHSSLSAGAVAAHMHQGAFGVNGGVVIGLASSAPNTWTGSGVLTPAQATTLNTGGMYFNVHTTTFPGGEIRGQIVESRSTRYAGVLSGAQEVPPNGSAATGTAVAWLHEPDNRLVYAVQSSGLTSVVAAHIHLGAAGSNGPVEFALNGSGGTYFGLTPKLTAAQLTALQANNYYVNVHTAAFPGGELRAQLLRDLGSHFTATCAGANEVPPTPSLSVGGAQIVLSPSGQVQLTGGFRPLASGAIAAHVHRGGVGVNGPVVFALGFAGGVLSGSYTPTAADLADLRSGLWYVNIHSTAFPGGELRGQLIPATIHTVYGDGCPGSSGVRPRMGATGFASMGSTWSMDLYGTAPGALSLIFVGDQRDPGPVELPVIGLAAPGCFALITSIVLQYTSLSNPQGYATQPLPIPVDPALRGIPLYVQSATLDGPANPAGLVTSNAMTFAVQ